jgi:broad specificity phosphatase PhoE
MATIYLMRHFKVLDSTAPMLDSMKYDEWVKLYDNTELDYTSISLPDVDEVYVSDLNRAIKTSEFLNLNSAVMKDLREVESKAFVSTKIKLHKNIWLSVDRLLWFFNLRKIENKRDTIFRAKKVANSLIDKQGKILIISHGLFMKVLARELNALGYIGKLDKRPQNNKVYAFETL